MVELEITSKSSHRSKQFTWLTSAALIWAILYLLNERLWDWLFFELFQLPNQNRLVAALHFWIKDFLKISLLLAGITFTITFLQSFISVEKGQAFLAKRNQGLGYAIAATLGTVTPFCSCSSVPIFIGFVSSRIPIGITMTFLIASPLVSELAFFMLMALFGWQLALLYAVSGISIAILAGFSLAAMRSERWLMPGTIIENVRGNPLLAVRRPSLQERINAASTEVVGIFRKLWPYLLAGLTVGAGLHGWMPLDLVNDWLGSSNPFSVLIAVAVGIPLYANASSVMPIVEVLSTKGLPVGTLLAFMMSVIALSLPEMILLKRVMQPKLLMAFIGVVATGIVFVGYLFNAIV